MDEIIFDEAQPTSIEGLTVARKRVFADQRGAVMHMLKGNQFEFPVGEIYFSLVHTGQIKGWKCHKEMWQRFTVPVGVITFVFVDKRPGSSTIGKSCVQTLSNNNHGVITVPPGIWYSFKAEEQDGIKTSLIANAASIPATPNESITSSFDEFDFKYWD